MPRTTTRLITAALAAFAVLGALAVAPRAAEAQLPPFKAFGTGLTAGQIVAAQKGSAEVGKATVSTSGNWELNIESGGPANVQNGDKITFTVDGKAANETATFNIGQFTPPPGLKLTVASAGPAGSTGPTAPALPPAASATAKGVLASNPAFDSTGRALAVFNGGTIPQLEGEAKRVEASGVWVQDADGNYRLLIVGGPAFLNDEFKGKFPNGVGVASVLLVK